MGERRIETLDISRGIEELGGLPRERASLDCRGGSGLLQLEVWKVEDRSKLIHEAPTFYPR